MRRAVCLLLLGAVLPAAGQSVTPAPARRVAVAAARAEVREVAFSSKALARTMKYRVLVPAGYGNGPRRYPVLYLLHGLYGSQENWEALTDLTRYAAGLDLIVVMPDAGNSWYVNSTTIPADRFEDYIVQDLIPEVDRTWRTIRSSHRRAVAGLSMGGYGALKFALKNPGMFAVAASISGALDAPLDLDERRADFRENLLAVFGPAGSATRMSNDVFRLAEAANAKSVPYLYLECGAADPFYLINHQFAALLQRRGLGYEYHEFPGAHTWEYWDHSLPRVLRVIMRVISSDQNR